MSLVEEVSINSKGCCAICYEDFPLNFYGIVAETAVHMMSCCGKEVCNACALKTVNKECAYCRHPPIVTLQDTFRARKKNADLGKPWAQSALAELYISGNGVPKDVNKAAKLFLQAADAGYQLAQFNIANLYESGTGVPIDIGKAMKYFPIGS